MFIRGSRDQSRINLWINPGLIQRLINPLFQMKCKNSWTLFSKKPRVPAASVTRKKQRRKSSGTWLGHHLASGTCSWRSWSRTRGSGPAPPFSMFLVWCGNRWLAATSLVCHWLRPEQRNHFLQLCRKWFHMEPSHWSRSSPDLADLQGSWQTCTAAPAAPDVLTDVKSCS